MRLGDGEAGPKGHQENARFQKIRQKLVSVALSPAYIDYDPGWLVSRADGAAGHLPGILRVQSHIIRLYREKVLPVKFAEVPEVL
jgi:hypothetical protein